MPCSPEEIENARGWLLSASAASEPGHPAMLVQRRMASSPATITGRAAEVNKPKAQGLGRRNRPRVEDAAEQRP